ncbi:MAG: DNA/RNA nuclease SfsA [Salinivirgaceae bacterium]|jgi:sugar fermentation stimulation protein A|nr:DNA/RNA nuclease SfsA [Salinivirgaceae bacterium]
MNFPQSLVRGILIKRYKRFLADVKLDNGEVVVAHCTNSGSMTSCIEEGAEVYLTPVNDPKRKTRFTWKMIKINEKWVGVNTSWPNVLAFNAINENAIDKLSGYTKVKREVTFNDSRFDIYCDNNQEKCFVEVKNVTMKVGEMALFPDAITTRGQKHLKTLMEVKKNGYRAVMLYIIQRTDVSGFGPAKLIDNNYARLLVEAFQNGVEIIAIQAKLTPNSIELVKELPVLLD